MRVLRDSRTETCEKWDRPLFHIQVYVYSYMCIYFVANTTFRRLDISHEQYEMFQLTFVNIIITVTIIALFC